MEDYRTWKSIGGAAEGAYHFAREFGVSAVTVIKFVTGPEAGRFGIKVDDIPVAWHWVERFSINLVAN